MTIKGLLRELRVNQVDENCFRIAPKNPVEGVLCLSKDDKGMWRIIFNDRGEFTVNEFFYSEHEACRFFLKKILLDPTNRKNFSASDLQTFPQKRSKLLEKYGFDEGGE